MFKANEIGRRFFSDLADFPRCLALSIPHSHPNDSGQTRILMCILIHMKSTRTNIVLDDKLVREALRLSGLETKKDVIHEALRYYIEHRSRPSLLELKGKISFSENFDYKATRRAQ